MVAVSFSTDFGAQVQLLQSRMASGDYDLAQVHAARLDEFDFLFSNTSPTVLRLTTSVVSLGFAGTGANYTLTLSGNGIGPDFARALCASLDRLRTLGHPKWEEVTLELGPAPPAGAYYEPTSIVLRDCRPVPGPGTAPSSRP